MTPKPLPSKRQLKSLFVYKKGLLYWKIDRSRRVKAGDIAGSISGGYKYVMINHKMYVQHRIIWTMTYGKIPDNLRVDHKDRNPLNNHISNLRLATVQQNAFNSKQRKSISGYRNITMRRGGKKWEAALQVGGKKVWIGSFDTAEAANKAFIKKSKSHYGKFSPISN